MENEFVTYGQALELKRLGFDKPCLGFYSNISGLYRYTNVIDGSLNSFQTIKNSSITVGDDWCSAPLYQQAFRWFRENGMVGEIFSQLGPSGTTKWGFKVLQSTQGMYDGYLTYEVAETECLKKLIEILKNKLK